MAISREIEGVFLYTLQEESPKDEIIKRIKYFGNYQWQALYGLAARAYLSPVFYSRLSSLKLEDIPDEFLSNLKNLYLLNLKRNILLERETLRILAYFKELNIPAIPIKGPILARYLYNDVGLRQASCDLDFLVEYETINEAGSRLRHLGYVFSLIEQKRDFLHPINTSGQVEQVVLTKRVDDKLSIILDLHWCIRGFFSDKSIKNLWQEARRSSLDGREILMPSHQDNLIYLSLISITTLEFTQLKYLYDIHRLVTVFKAEIHWEGLLSRARDENLENCLYFPLKLAKTLFLTDIPDTFLGAIKPDWHIRKLISLWINERSVLEFRRKVKASHPLRYLLGRYLYSTSLNDFLRKSFNRIFNTPR